MNQKQTLLVMLLSFLLLLSGCIQPLPEETPAPMTSESVSESTSDTQPARPVYLYQTMTYQYKTDVTASVSYFATDLDADYLLLANKSTPLGSDYVPNELTVLTCPTSGNKPIELEKRTAQALYAMLGEMRADGVTDIYVTSGYRAYEYQQQLYRNYLNKEKSTITQDAYACLGAEYIQQTYLSQGLDRLTEEDAIRVVLSYSALPGTSEHQSGLCVDFVDVHAGALTEAFENTEAFGWLSENAYRFGFILRYPPHKTAVTGYTYEPWHYRFVGREAATEIYFRDLTLEEFLTDL